MNTISFRNINKTLLDCSIYLLNTYKTDKVIDSQRFSQLFKRAQFHLRGFSEVKICIRIDSALYLSYEQKALWLNGLCSTIRGEENIRMLRTSLNSMKPLIK